MDVKSIGRLPGSLVEAMTRRGLAGFTYGLLTWAGFAFVWPAKSDARKKSDKDKDEKKEKKQDKRRRKREKKRRERTPEVITDYCAAAGPWPDGEESAFLTLINEYRASYGLAPLVQHPQLAAAAEFHSQDMAANNYYDHVSPTGVTSEQNIRNHGYTEYLLWAENITAGYDTAYAALARWQFSAGHNANILNPDFNEIGIGRACNANALHRWYWTTTFGSRGA